MKTLPLLIALLLVPTLAFAQDAPEVDQPAVEELATVEEPAVEVPAVEEVAVEEPQPVMCLVATSLDDGGETLTNVHVESQLLLGKRGSVKLTLTYETRLADAECKEVTLALPADGTTGDATIIVGASTLVVPAASVTTNANGELILTGDSLSSTVEDTPVS